MNKFPFFKSLLVAFGFIFIISCDKDYNEIGANIIGDDNFVFDKDNLTPVFAFNQFDAAVQSNNLPINMLGVYNDADFGTTTASFVTQLALETVSPDIPDTAIIDQVILTVPYFSHLKENSSDTYILDSIYGNGKIKLGIYETSTFLNTLDGQTLLDKKYFSNQINDFNTTIVGTKLNDLNVTQNDEFTFSDAQQTEIKLTSGVTTLKDGSEETIPVTPRMKLELNKAFFQSKLIGAIPATKLETNAIFNEYFKGLFFKVEQFGSEKAMAQLDFTQGKIVVYYKLATADTTRKTITLNMVKNTLNLFENQYNAGLSFNETPTLATTDLFLKGGSGFHSYIDLFGTADENGEIPTKDALGNYVQEIKRIKDNNWIINEANLIFTSSSATSFADSPNRIYLYDAKNKRPILDYYTDSFVNTANPKYGKTTHGGTKYTENGLTKYKIRITNHIKNIINKDSTNVRLGLVVTEDINTVTNLFIKNAPTDKYYNRVPVSSVINPLGTILYGSDASVEDSKRIKLEIFYTKPN